MNVHVRARVSEWGGGEGFNNPMIGRERGQPEIVMCPVRGQLLGSCIFITRSSSAEAAAKWGGHVQPAPNKVHDGRANRGAAIGARFGAPGTISGPSQKVLTWVLH